jgi:microsomal dipeptidase-like Zn-dependent dipeptidase
MKNVPWKRGAVAAAVSCVVACGNPQYYYDLIVNDYASPTVDKDPPPTESYYGSYHRGLDAVIDMHADTLTLPDDKRAGSSARDYLERLLTNPDRDGHVDFPRMRQGNSTLQVFSVASKASIDIAGNSAAFLTGSYKDVNGLYGPRNAQLSRYDFERDPNVSDYDDPLDPYRKQYGPLGLPRDPVTYMSRLAGFSCLTWFEDGNWDSSWGSTPASCTGFDAERMYVQRLLEPAQRLLDASARDPRFRVVRTRAELEALLAARRVSRDVVGGMLSTEGLYFRSDVSSQAGRDKLNGYLDALWAKGFRMYGLTHFLDNDHAGSSTGMARGSDVDGRDLSPAGHFVATRVLERGGVLDVAHASPRTVRSLSALAREKRRPLVYSHGGFREIRPLGTNTSCQRSRNLDDALIREIASTGGVVGVGFAAEFVCGEKPEDWANAVRHVVDVIDAAQLHLYNDPSQPLLRGIDHVGLGSDWDGGVKAYTDVAHLDQYTRALLCKNGTSSYRCLSRYFNEAETRKIMGQNVLRVLRANLPIF